ncbi:MAG: TRAP transporter small permease subunit [Woeseiaceae bacterium]|nr:TRAP transporter small permease subunit [Woeseiaceae bacterium]
MSARNTGTNNALDRFSEISGRVTAWLTLLMVIVTTIVVVMRYVFDAGLIWVQESVTWMHAVVFMLGAAYTLRHEEHVRVDIFYRNMSAVRRAWVDAAGVVVFLLPMCGFLALKSWDFVVVSWSMQEASRESGGLPYPFVPLLKAVLLLMPVVVALQGLSLLLQSVATIRKGGD